MSLDWYMYCAILGGAVVGYMAGTSNAFASGIVAAVVSVMTLGLFTFKSPGTNSLNEYIGQRFFWFLVCLIAAYVITSKCRQQGKLTWMGKERNDSDKD